MANSTQEAVSDGTLMLLDISISYLERSEITVFYDNVLNTTNWSWVGTTEKRLAFSPAVPNGVVVLVKRTTDIVQLRHEFSQGATFTAQTLDEDLNQVLHIVQEATEANFSADFYLDINMHSFKVTNLANAVDPQDALPLGQFQAMVVPYVASASNYADAAASSASAANASAIAAAASAASINPADIVHISGSETILGTKGFALSPLIPNIAGPDSSTKAANTAFVNHASIVHVTGAESIAGVKTFTDAPVVPTQAPGDSSAKAASTAYAKAAADAALAAALVDPRVWVDVRASPGRAASTPYTNGTQRAIQVKVCYGPATLSEQAFGLTATVAGVMISGTTVYSRGGAYVSSETFDVPPGATYQVDVAGPGSITRWVELR